MKNFRANLTRLSTLITDKIPDEKDVFGYQGISKELLLSAVTTAYDLSQEIEKKDDQPRFEIIALKRFGSETNALLKDILDSDIPKDRFDDFLNRLSTLVEKVKLTYFIVTKDGLRSDEELAGIRQAITDTRMECEKLMTNKQQLEDNLERADGLVGSIGASRDQADSDYTKISEWHRESEALYTGILNAHDGIEGWDKEIKECRDEISEKNANIDELTQKVTVLEGRMSTNVNECELSKAELIRLVQENKALNDEINKTLGDANRVGMAASFQNRKDELTKELSRWQLVFVIAIAGIVAVTLYLLPEFTKDKLVWTQIMGKLAIVSPFVWLGWFAARQYGYVCRIREDYAFKYAASMAYEGHKKATREVNEDLEKVLLEFSLFNMAQNPIRLYYIKSDHVTPLHEFTETILNIFPSFRKMKKAEIDIATIGKAAFESNEPKSRPESGN